MKAMQVMSALAQPTRLDVFTRLAASLPDGMSAGDLAAATKAAPSAMSAHLAILSRAGLVKSTKIGRSVVYRAVTTPLDGLVDFLSDVRGAGLRGGATEG